MAYRRNKGGLDISGATGRRPPKLSGSNKKRSGLSTGQSAQQRIAMSRAAKGRGTYIHPSGYGKQKRFSRRGIIVGIIVAVLALALAIGVGFIVYQQTVRNALKPTLDLKALEAELTKPKENDTSYWSVIVETNASSAEQGRGEVASLALVNSNSDNATLSILWIPTDTRVYIDGYGYHTIGDAFSLSGEVGIVEAVEKLASVDIAHYFELNEAGFNRFMSSLEPLSVDVSTASRETLSAAVCKKIFGTSSEQISSLAATVTECIASDATRSEIEAGIRALHGINIDTSFYQTKMPSKTDTIDGVTCSIVESDSWNTMVTRTSNGMSPVADSTEVSTNNVTRSKCTVAVWNGVGVSGVANDCSNELKKLGWNVISTGNAAQFVYEETFVVYKDTDDEAAARLLASDLGQGRVVRSAARYSYTGNLLVVVGKDYKPYE